MRAPVAQEKAVARIPLRTLEPREKLREIARRLIIVEHTMRERRRCQKAVRPLSSPASWRAGSLSAATKPRRVRVYAWPPQRTSRRVNRSSSRRTSPR
jgi:hypothetical protein